MDKDEQDQTKREFDEAVNMTAKQLEDWLGTEESKTVGAKSGGESGSESVGHESGRRIVRLLGTKRADLTDDDYGHMRKVVGYVHRHLAQSPGGDDVQHSRWRYSLMNWGHDPQRS